MLCVKMRMSVHFKLTLYLCLHNQAYRKDNISVVWNVKLTQGQDLKTCGASLENYRYIDTVSLAVCFHWKSCIPFSAHTDTIYPKESICCLLTAKKQDKCNLQIPDEFRPARKRQRFQPSTFHSRCVHCVLLQAFVHTSPRIAFSYILTTTSTLMLPQYFDPPAPIAFSFISINTAFVSCVFCTSPAPAFHLALLQTLEARSCCCASICCCCLAAISCNSASVMSMRGVATFEENTHL